MSDAAIKKHSDFVLPPSVVTKMDLSRLLNEFERIDNELTTAAVRSGVGVQEQTTLALSNQLTEFFTCNGLKPATAHARSDVIKQLRLLKDTAPIIHMTFAVVPDAESLQQLAQWLRESVHPQAVMTVGLQPGLVAGVYMRTPNHVHDLSLRARLKESRDLLTKELEALRERA